MKDILKATILVLLFLVSAGFFSRYPGGKLEAAATGSNSDKVYALEREGEMAALPAGEDRTNSLPWANGQDRTSA